MKVHVTLTDDQGRTYTGEAELTATQAPSHRRAASHSQAPAPHRKPDTKIDFSLGERAFVRKYVADQTSGHAKFVILLALMSKGKTGDQITVEALSKLWAKLKGPMGGIYHNIYATRAKDSDWVDSPKKGVFTLRPSWKDAFAK